MSNRWSKFADKTYGPALIVTVICMGVSVYSKSLGWPNWVIIMNAAVALVASLSFFYPWVRSLRKK